MNMTGAKRRIYDEQFKRDARAQGTGAGLGAAAMRIAAHGTKGCGSFLSRYDGR